ncbi:MAG TPA: helix-hairpin-helix domain-containing protein, partial [Chitinophagaceae bacterium]
MKKGLLHLLFLSSFLQCSSQEIPESTQQQFENLTDAQQADITDDSYLQQLDHFKRHPMNLNLADVNELKQLIFLNDLQIDNLITYRNLLGRLVSIYELQAVPSWDIATIKKILPYVTVENAIPITEDFRKRIKNGDRNLIFRFAEVMEKAQGFKKTG